MTPALDSIRDANVPPLLLAEPFGVGAITSLRLVGSDKVQHVVLAEASPLVAAFWYIAAFDTGWHAPSKVHDR